MKRGILSTGAVLLLLGWWLAMPDGHAQVFQADKPLGEIEQSMETNLKWNIQNALLLYYPETKFVVNTRVKLRKPVRQRALPKLPDALLSKDLTNLPGLPYLPKEMNEAATEDKQTASLKQEVADNSYKVDGIHINVLVDQSLGDKDRAFIRRFVTMTANLEPQRGDQVRIEALTFPQRSDFASEQEAATLPKPDKQPLPNANVEPPDPVREWYPYWFAAGLAAFLLILFLMGQRSIVKHVKPVSAPAVQRSEPVMPAATLEKPVESKPEPEGISKNISAMDVLKSSAIDAVVGTPAASAKVLNGWIDRDGDESYRQIGILFKSVSLSLLDLVEPYIGRERSEAIHHEVTGLSDAELAEHFEPILKIFDEDIRRLALRDKFDSDDDALSFLHQMSDDQLQHLLKPLKTGVMAIVLAQLRSNRAAKILDKLEPDQRKAVLASMGNIERIPADVYQHIARQLASRAQELKRMRHVRANGVDALVKVMDHLDEQTQSDTIEYLKTQDVELAKKVRQQFVTFEDLVNNPDDRLRQAALAVDRDTLAKSLITLDEQVVENIITSLPEKLAEMVRASMEVNHDVTEKDVTEARRAIVRSMRTKRTQQTKS